MRPSPKTFAITGIVLVVLTLVGVADAALGDRLSPDGRLGLGLSGLQAAVIGWAALGATPGLAARRGALTGVLGFVVAGALAVLSFAVAGNLRAAGLYVDDEMQGWPVVVGVAAALMVFFSAAATALGLAARAYTRLPDARMIRYLWLFAALSPILPILPDDIYVTRPSTWDALPARLPESLLSLAALVWLALLLRVTRHEHRAA
ncbi:MAG: hypothetical protein Q7T55_03845, partial [Solirubrobacteraceae bacterium]|nr:hypothetical protein [Solirubrobacteraceae bacterium]